MQPCNINTSQRRQGNAVLLIYFIVRGFNSHISLTRKSTLVVKMSVLYAVKNVKDMKEDYTTVYSKNLSLKYTFKR